MIQQLIRHGFIHEAYRGLKPMVTRVVRHGDFYEWWSLDNQPHGSPRFRGSAGVLGKAIKMLSLGQTQTKARRRTTRGTEENPCKPWPVVFLGHALSTHKAEMNLARALNLRQVLECGNGAHAVTALRLQPARLEQSDASDFTNADAKAVNSLNSSPHSKPLARGTQVHGSKRSRIREKALRSGPGKFWQTGRPGSSEPSE